MLCQVAMLDYMVSIEFQSDFGSTSVPFPSFSFSLHVRTHCVRASVAVRQQLFMRAFICVCRRCASQLLLSHSVICVYEEGSLIYQSVARVCSLVSTVRVMGVSYFAAFRACCESKQASMQIYACAALTVAATIHFRV